MAVEFAVADEARFLSHQDMVRLMERAAARAEIPVKFSQGFNPRPKMLLPLPRPVGVASRCERLVLELEQSRSADETLSDLRRQMPEGITPTACHELPDDASMQAQTVGYELNVSADQVQALRQRLAELSHQDCWPWVRQTPKAGQDGKAFDLRPLVRQIDLDNQTLRFSLTEHGSMWARPEEVLDLLGLDRQLDLARLVRTEVRWRDRQE